MRRSAARIPTGASWCEVNIIPRLISQPVGEMLSPATGPGTLRALLHYTSGRVPSTVVVLSSSLEQCGDGVEAVMAGVDPGQQGVELIGDASLFLMRGKGGDIGTNILRSHRWVKSTLNQL